MDKMCQEKIRWDAHGCPPFTIGSDLSFLNRYKSSGVDFVSMNVGFDLTTESETLSLIDYFNKFIEKNSDRYEIIKNLDQIIPCKEKNKLGISFDLEGCNLIQDNIDKLDRLHQLGVRQISFCYNKNNFFGGGCFDSDIGLTSLGKKLVKKANQSGIIIDCSHVGFKTSMDIVNISEHPVVFSHSNVYALVKNPRNISDEQMLACASTGGVIGINGVSLFLGDQSASSEKIVEHIDYVAQKIGVQHVGIGMDCLFNFEEVQSFVDKDEKAFPKEYFSNPIKIAEPEQFSDIKILLNSRGYKKNDIDLILGENFFRVAKSVWK